MSGTRSTPGRRRRYARRAAVVLAATAAVVLAVGLGSAFSEGYRNGAR